MNKTLLMLINRNLQGWLTECHIRGMSTDKKLEVLMHAIADLCQALAADTADEAVQLLPESLR